MPWTGFSGQWTHHQIHVFKRGHHGGRLLVVALVVAAAPLTERTSRLTSMSGGSAPRYASCTVLPPTTVRTTGMSLSVLGSTSCGSWPSITKSASLPVVIDPFTVSS